MYGMSSDPASVTNDISGYPPSPEMDAAPDVREGPPPVLPPPFDPAESRRPIPPPPPENLREPEATAAAAEAWPTVQTPESEPPQDDGAESSWQEFKLWLIACVSQLLYWYREDGFWYLTSMTVHAVGLFSLALISLAIPRTIITSSDTAPLFDGAKVDQAQPVDLTRFEVGETPIDPKGLSLDTRTDSKALPIGGPEEKFYDNSSVFEEAGGGILTDLKGPKLGGLGGFSVKDLPGPAGRGGVGVGAGFGKNPGSGGAGIGFGGRGSGHLQKGATQASERAVLAALNWLHRHQTQQGKWTLDYRHQCKGGTCSGYGFFKSDSAATALALLPFLAAGETHKSKGPYQPTVTKGINWLVKQQRSDGDLSGGCDQPMYAHGLATIVLCEVYGMTRDERVGLAAREAVAFIERAQNESTGGWRYLPGQAGDTSVFGWQVMALKSAQLAGLPVNSIVFDNAQRWLRSVAKGEHLGLYSYRPYEDVRLSMTAVGMLCRQYMGVDPKDPGILEGKRSLLEHLPDNNLGRDTYYWYYATQAMHNFMDRDWDTWNRTMRRALIETQVKQGCATGSWDPDKPTPDTWGKQGGRLMTTSLSALSLEVYYRYLPLFKTDSLVPEAASKAAPARQVAEPAQGNAAPAPVEQSPDSTP
jgi:hypothetical protein